MRNEKNWLLMEQLPEKGQLCDLAWFVNGQNVKQVNGVTWLGDRWESYWTPMKWRPAWISQSRESRSIR